MFYDFCFFFFKQKTAYEMRISDWSSDVCSSDLLALVDRPGDRHSGFWYQEAAQCRRRSGFGGQELQAVDEGRRGRRAEDAGSTRARTAKARQRSARARARADAQLIGITPSRPAHVRYRSEEKKSELQEIIRNIV